MHFQKLSERHLPMVDAFHCVETDETLSKYPSKIRRRIRLHSQEMEDFLKQEALNEQECNMNTTYLLIEDDKILAYVSLCNDAIRLELTEREAEGVRYESAPALKIARLAVETSQMGNGIGKLMIAFSALCGLKIREHAGVFFLTLDCYAHRVSYYEGIGFARNNNQPVVLPYDSPISMRMSIDAYLESFEEI